MTLENLSLAFRSYRELVKIAKSLHRLDEAACNYGLTERQEKAVIRLIGKSRKIASELVHENKNLPFDSKNIPQGLTTYHQGDPRGCSLYLVNPNDKDKFGYINYTNGIAII